MIRDEQAEQIRALLAANRQDQWTMLCRDRQVGEILQARKARTPHGHWERWLKTTGLHERSAAHYMYLAAHWPIVAAKANPDSPVTRKKAIALIQQTLAEQRHAAQRAIVSALRPRIAARFITGAWKTSYRRGPASTPSSAITSTRMSPSAARWRGWRDRRSSPTARSS